MKNRSFAPFAFIFKVLNLSLMNCFPLTLGKFMGRQPIKERCFDNRQYGAPIQNLIWKTNPFLWWVIFRIFQFCMNQQVFFKGYIKCDFQSHLLKKNQKIIEQIFPKFRNQLKRGIGQCSAFFIITQDRNWKLSHYFSVTLLWNRHSKQCSFYLS